MDNNHELNEKLAKNLTYYRKVAGFTQAELAEKINYSDKSVSKWESGNGVPDIYTLVQLSKLYNVSLNELVGEDVPHQIPENPPIPTRLRVLIMLLSSGIVWLVAILAFVVLQIAMPDAGAWWLCFLYAVLVNAIVMTVFAGVWKMRLVNFFSISVLIWVGLTCLYLTVQEIVFLLNQKYVYLGFIFLIGIPLQVLEVLWTFFRSILRKFKESLKKKKSNQ